MLLYYIIYSTRMWVSHIFAPRFCLPCSILGDIDMSLMEPSLHGNMLSIYVCFLEKGSAPHFFLVLTPVFTLVSVRGEEFMSGVSKILTEYLYSQWELIYSIYNASIALLDILCIFPSFISFLFLFPFFPFIFSPFFHFSSFHSMIKKLRSRAVM